MTQSGDLLESALAERVNGVLKQELLEMVYTESAAARLSVATAVSIYNHQLLERELAHASGGAWQNRKTEETLENYYAAKKGNEVLIK